MNATPTRLVYCKGQRTVRLLLFSVLREAVGTSQLSVVFDRELSGTDLLDFLASEYSSIKAYRKCIRMAVNELYVSESIGLSDGDEVALITPVSGG